MTNDREKVIKYIWQQIEMIVIHEHGSLQMYDFTQGQNIIFFVERQESCPYWFKINIANDSII